MTIGAMSTYDERGSPELTAGQNVEVPKSTITKDSETAAFLDSKMENTKEPRVNEKFFDTHTNVGVMDNCSWESRDTIQCPFNPSHRFSLRKENHFDQCTRARNCSEKLLHCHYNPFHRFFAHQEAQHYRLCATFLMIKARYRYNFPGKNDIRMLSSRIEGDWTHEKYLAACKENLKIPQDINYERNFDWFERHVTNMNFMIGFELLAPLCKVVVAEGKKVREGELHQPLSRLPNFYNRRRPRLQLFVKQEDDNDPEFCHLSLKPIKKSPNYGRPSRETWGSFSDSDAFFRAEVEYKAPVNQKFLSDMGWAFFDWLSDHCRTEEETGVTQSRNPQEFLEKVWLPKLHASGRNSGFPS